MWWLVPWLALAGPLEDGDAAFARGTLPEAISHWAVALRQAREQGDENQALEILLRLGAGYRGAGQLQAAQDSLQTAQRLAADDAARARVQLAQAQLLRAQGRLGRAESSFLDCFRAARQAGAPAVAAPAALELGLVRTARGHPGPALEALGAAATLFEALGDEAGVADVAVNRGLALRRAGDLRGARSALEEAIGRFAVLDDADGQADAQANLALVLEDLGRDDLALAQHQAALETARQRRDVRRQAVVLGNVAVLHHRAGRAEEAAQSYKAAERAWRTLELPLQALSVALNRAQLGSFDVHELEALRTEAQEAGNPGLLAQADLALAGALRSQDPKRARRLAVGAARAGRQLALREVTWRARALEGQLALELGERREAIEALGEAVDALELLRRGAAVADQDAFASRYSEVYQSLIDALLADGDRTGALVVAERLARAQVGGGERPEGIEAYQALLAEQQSVEDALAQAVADDPDGEAATLLREQLSALRVAFAAEVDTLRARYPDFDRWVAVDPQDLEAVQASLAPGVVVVQPVALPDRLVLMVLRRERLETLEVEVPLADIHWVTGPLTRLLQSGRAEDPNYALQLCDKLGEWLLAPLAEELRTAEVLVVAATGPFRQLPLTLARHEGRWLVEEAAVVQVTHVGSLGRDAGEGLRIDGKSMLLLGNPDGSLPGAEAEVNAIAARFRGAALLTGADGTREALLDRLAGRRVLHLATHGVVDPRKPDRSYLLLAGQDELSSRLGYREIPGLAPWMTDVRLVVLSACESGLPMSAELGPDGLRMTIDGLAAQFRRAGVETLVASLWTVADASTMRLMLRFYEELSRGSDVAHAMQRAQLELLTDPDTAHPFYWAPFVVVGDWR